MGRDFQVSPVLGTGDTCTIEIHYINTLSIQYIYTHTYIYGYMNTNIHLYTYVDTTAYPPQLVGPSGCLSRHGLGHPPVHQRNAIRGTRPAAPTGPRPGENTGRGQVRPPTTPGPPATAQRAVGVGGGSAVAGCTESRACFEWVGGGAGGVTPTHPVVRRDTPGLMR